MRPFHDLSYFDKQKGSSLYKAPVFWIQGAGKSEEQEMVAVPEEELESENLSCRYLARSRVCEHFFQRRKDSNFLSVEYIYEGEFLIRCGRNAYVAEAGDLFLLHPGNDNDLLSCPDSNCRKAGIILLGIRLPEILKLLHLEHVETVHMPVTRWDDLFLQMKKSLFRIRTHPDARQRLSGLVFELLTTISDLYKTAAIPAEIAEARVFMEKNFSRSFKMEFLAEDAGMSLPTFNLYFQKSFHTTPYQYLIRTRLLHAAHLLEGSRKPIKEIANLSGYGTPSHFSTEFARYYGCSPCQFRSRQLARRR